MSVDFAGIPKGFITAFWLLAKNANGRGYKFGWAYINLELGQRIHLQFTKLQVPHSNNYENFHLR